MKRINLETNKPFKCGDIREDGFMFDAYVKSVTRIKTGYYKEIWRSPEQHAKEMQRKRDGKKIKYDLISEHINNIKIEKGCGHCGYCGRHCGHRGGCDCWGRCGCVGGGGGHSNGGSIVQSPDI